MPSKVFIDMIEASDKEEEKSVELGFGKSRGPFVLYIQTVGRRHQRQHGARNLYASDVACGEV